MRIYLLFKATKLQACSRLYLILTLSVMGCFGVSAVAETSVEDLIEQSLKREESLSNFSGTIEVEAFVSGRRTSREAMRIDFWIGNEGEYLVDDGMTRECLQDGILTITHYDEYIGGYTLVFNKSILESPEMFANDWAVESWAFVEDIVKPLGRNYHMGLKALNKNYQLHRVESMTEDVISLKGVEKVKQDSSIDYVSQLLITFSKDKKLLSEIRLDSPTSVCVEQWNGYAHYGNDFLIPSEYNMRCTIKEEAKRPGSEDSIEFNIRIIDIHRKEWPASIVDNLPVYDFRKWGRVQALNRLEPLEETLAAVDDYIFGAPIGSTLLWLACVIPVGFAVSGTLLFALLPVMLILRYRAMLH